MGGKGAEAVCPVFSSPRREAGVRCSLNSTGGSQDRHSGADPGTGHADEEVQIVRGESKSRQRAPREGLYLLEAGVGSH